MPWPLQVVFWFQIADVVANLIELLLTSNGKPGLAAVGEYVVFSAVTVFLMIKLRAGGRWVRSVLTLVLVIDLLFVVLRMITGQFPPVLLTVSAALALVLLYWPSSNTFFASRQGTTSS